MSHLDSFAWIRAFSPAPNTKAPEQLGADPAGPPRRLRLLPLSCGNQDSLIAISQGVHAYLKKENVPHIWHVGMVTPTTHRSGEIIYICLPLLCE